MAISNLGRTLIIANPAAHSGRGAEATESVSRFFDWCTSVTNGYELMSTKRSGDAQQMAANAAGFDTVVALGGDGVIHEVGNGLMELPLEERPRLGVIPFGSGNDFARTLGLTPNDTNAAIHELLTGDERTMDVGHVSSDTCPEGTYFLETLSFGLDAAIAVDTTVRRSEGTSQQGAGLFVTSSLRIIAQAYEGWSSVLRINGRREERLKTLILAVQNGPTYGGGFRICPQAVIDDGMLDLCYNVRQPWIAHMLLLFGLARFGMHTSSPVVRLCKTDSLEVAFDPDDGACPCQVDGEVFQGTRYTIKVVPAALRVIAKA